MYKLITITLITATWVHSYSEFCKRKTPVYHDTDKKPESKENIDYAAVAALKYLSKADYVQKEVFMKSFDWDKIKKKIRDAFLGECSASSSRGILKYNYSIALNVTVQTKSNKNDDMNNIVKKLAKELLSQDDKTIKKYINDTTSKVDYRLPKVEHITYKGSSCNDITVDEVTIGGFSINKVQSSEHKSTIPVYFKGVSTHSPYGDSDKFLKCVMEKISGSAKSKGTVKVEKSITSNCEKCTMDLIMDVTSIPEEFYTTLQENGAKVDDLTELFYRCMVTGNKHCSDYVPTNRKSTEDKLSSLSAYIKKRRDRGRRKRDTDSKTSFSKEALMCMYRNYGTDDDDEDFSQCNKPENVITDKVRTKRGISDEEDDDIGDYLKKILNLEEVIPKDAAYLQVGATSENKRDKVIGDSSIYRDIKRKSRNLLQGYMPTIKEETDLDMLNAELEKKVRFKLEKDTKNIVSGSMRAILEKKTDSIKSILKKKRVDPVYQGENSGYTRHESSIRTTVVLSKDDFSTDRNRLEHSLRGNQYRYPVMEEKQSPPGVYKALKDYVSKGGKGLNVLTSRSRVSTGMFNIDTSTTLLSPSKIPEARANQDVIHHPLRRTYGVLNVNDPKNYQDSIVRKRCRRSSQGAVCGILGRIALSNTNNNANGNNGRDRPANTPNENIYLDTAEANNHFRARGFQQGRVENQNEMNYVNPLQVQGLFRNRIPDQRYADAVQAQQVYGIQPPQLPQGGASPPVPPHPPQPPPLPRLPRPVAAAIHQNQIYFQAGIPSVAGPELRLSSTSSASSVGSNGIYEIVQLPIDGYPGNPANRPLPRIPIRSDSSDSSDHIYETIGSRSRSYAGSSGTHYNAINGGSSDGGSSDGSSGRGGGRGGGGRRGGRRGDNVRSSTSSEVSADSGTNSYESNIRRIGSSVDKAMVFSLALQMMTMNAINRQSRLERMERGFRDTTDEILEAVSTSLTTVGTSMATVGIVTSPHLAFAGMGLSLISGLIDAGKDIYYFFSGVPRPLDPVVQKFSMYRDIVSDTSHMGVRKCMMPGYDITVFLSYRNDSSFMPTTEKLATYFIDTIDSVLYYLNTSGIIIDFSLTVACPIGYLRSPTLDITSYTKLKFTTEDNVKFYQFTRLGAMLSKFSTVELTCGKDSTLTLKPFEVPISEMELLKMSTPGEPEETKSIPSNVCDIFPMKNFYLSVKGCPYDGSQVAITRTTCSILLRMATWDDVRDRWVLENPFERNSKHRQLFTFEKYDFNHTVIKPNTIPGHAKFCSNRQIKECYWTDVMILDDITTCSNRARTLYVELNTFDSNRGFTSFVLTCPSGSTPVAVGDKDGIIELPLADFYTVKMFSSIKPRTIGVFCVNNYDKRYKSDMIMVSFINPKYDNESVLIDTYEGKNRIFDDLTGNHRMPWRSRTCVTWKQGRTCIGYYGKVEVWTPDFLLQVDVGSELLVTEKYDPNTVDIYNIEKANLKFPYELDVEFSVGNLGMAYDDPDRFWLDAEKQFRTYSSILLVVLPCTSRANILTYKAEEIISVLGYIQSMTNDYGDGKKYTFKHIEGGECMAELDLKTKLMRLKCPMFTIPRTINKYEGLCFVTITSRDHCAIQSDDYKKYGYPKTTADKVRYCGSHVWPDERDPGHYCGYISNLNHVPYTHPKYEACRANILIHYRDTWIESEVLDKPPYVFDFKYDKKSTNEYVDKELSDKLEKLYKDYTRLMEYRDGSLPNAINRLASALTNDGRSISDVVVDSEVLEIAYEADKEKILELEESIVQTTRDVLINTLSDEDVEEIFYKESDEKCCLLDVVNNSSIKLYPDEHYTCGVLKDFMYTDDENTWLLVNGSFVDYDLVGVTGIPILTCFYPTIVPLKQSVIKDIEKNLLLHAIEDAMQDLIYDLDATISTSLIKNNITSLS
ncbi:variola B22R gene family protein [Fowlpox virus]|nr:variola B22R gene family protein [Fowlpox virus]URH25339.1 variola B22R gene family protein [Fowlpox virus]URH25858.1 variola B22R gene family protein [Fowlpox virus]URH26122.1 variola B22R gene family protein [Fowlpox virus]URH26385.1 variola B22R gene family protein [Fowlpox virus]